MQHPRAPRPVLAASDLTAASDAVVRTAARIAAATGAELHLLHALETLFPSYPDPAATPEPAEAVERVPMRLRLQAAEEALWAQLRRAVPEAPAPGGSAVQVDAPHRAVARRARQVGAGLVVLGPHRQRMVADRLLGTTADRVIRGAECPVLVVRGEPRLPLRRITVPIDPRDPAAGALDVALGMARALGAHARDGELTGVELRVLHLAQPAAGAEGWMPRRAVVGPEMSPAVEAALARAGGCAEVEVREEVVWGGPPAREIVRLAEEDGTELLVLGTHGRGAVGRALAGSVGSEVARAAPCPVLLVPPRMWRGRARRASPDAALAVEAAGR
jgi:nucleotide-binding universal stress UspA family protein